MADRMQDYIDAAVASAPPMTDSQRERIASLLRPRRDVSAVPMKIPAAPRVALYRHFDAAGQLLYVGIATNFSNRTSQHSANSPWLARFAHRVEAVWLPTREAALAAERYAIQAEAPIFNKVHAMPERDARAVQYLIDHGASDLLKPRI